MASTKCGWNSVPGGASSEDLLVFWGPLLFVDIGFDPSYKAAPASAPPTPGRTNLPAMVDTGATESCIDSLLAAQLNLPIVDKRMQAGAHGAKEVAIHLAQIYIPTLGQTIYGGFAAVDLRMGGQSIDALIGRSFLRRFRMIYEGPTGLVELSTP